MLWQHRPNLQLPVFVPLAPNNLIIRSPKQKISLSQQYTLNFGSKTSKYKLFGMVICLFILGPVSHQCRRGCSFSVISWLTVGTSTCLLPHQLAPSGETEAIQQLPCQTVRSKETPIADWKLAVFVYFYLKPLGNIKGVVNYFVSK